ncbi:MAG: flagellar hook-basal body complex protein [Candidatus Goldbacteria bacterium]|nr:flagellar hook-basal body complex protein [Candidatus Goldiibacteriota bacterium]
MMGSLFSSISGLRNHSTWMNTIGNNISNVNTVGYKAQRVTFKEQITQLMGSASGANLASNIGGKNPMQMGLGSALGSIDSIMTQGAIQTTGNPLDVAITGEGFFTVKSGTQTLYTRAGNFYHDNLGNITTSSGGIVQGWTYQFERQIGIIDTNIPAWHRNPNQQIVNANYTLDTTGPIGNINIPSDLRMAAQSTTVAFIVGNLDSNTPRNGATVSATGYPAGTNILPANEVANPMADPGATGIPLATVQQTATFFTGVTPDAQTTMTIYDSLGNPRQITLWFFQRGGYTDPATLIDYRPYWDWYAFDTTGGVQPAAANCIAGSQITATLGPDPNNPAQNRTVTYSGIWFNDDGSLASNGAEWAPANGIQGQFNDPITGQTYYGPTIVIQPDGTNTAGLNLDGALQVEFCLNFGRPNTWGAIPIQVNSATNTPILQPGDRSGLTGDVSGQYQMVGGVTTYIPNNYAYAKEVTGWRSGDLISLSVDSTGGINGLFSNDKTLTLAKLAIAVFANPQGLERVGDSMYALSSNSGLPNYTVAGERGAGTTTGGALESSNVDLSVELTNMIIAQRGFESNARIITTSADMLDTLVNLGR